MSAKLTGRGGAGRGQRRPTNAERGLPDRDHVAKTMVEQEIADWLRLNGGSKLHYEILRKAYQDALIV